MKSRSIVFLVIVGGAVCASSFYFRPHHARKDEDFKLAYQMQDAVLGPQAGIAKVEALLKQGVDVNAAIGCGGYAPLDGAIDRHNVGLFMFLLAHGARPHAGNLAWAAFAGNDRQAFEMTRALIDAGMDPSTRAPDGNNALLSATYRGNRELVRFLLSQRGIALDEFDVDGFSALMWAVKNGEPEIADMLLQAGASVRATNKRGETALSIAGQEVQRVQRQQAILSKLQAKAEAMADREAKVETLPRQGAGVNAPMGPEASTPLDGALDPPNLEMLKSLLAHGARPQPRNLAAAALMANKQLALEMTKALIGAGMNPSARAPDGDNALTSAAFQGNQELVRFLLSQRGIKLDDFDANDFTALMWAAQDGDLEIADMLLQAGAHVRVKNKRGETALSIAEEEVQKHQNQQTILSKLQAAEKYR